MSVGLIYVSAIVALSLLVYNEDTRSATIIMKTWSGEPGTSCKS